MLLASSGFLRGGRGWTVSVIARSVAADYAAARDCLQQTFVCNNVNCSMFEQGQGSWS